MKISVLIIAHNEEKYIARCIESVLQQTQKADEIILIVHNSTDHTKEIAEKYSITVIPYSGPAGITYARIEGLKYGTGEMILCIDGDSYVAKNWISEMTKALVRNQNLLVGSWVIWKGNFFSRISSFFNKYFCVSKNKKATYWIWGPSMAFWGKDKEVVRDIFIQSYSLSEKIGLSRNPDDFWLALFMSKRGNIEVVNTTFVAGHTKEKSFTEAWNRNRENNKNVKKMKAFFEKEHPML